MRINSPFQQGERLLSAQQDDYGKLKVNYEKLVQKNQKTDFANSPVLLQKEFDALQELKDIASKQKLEAELVWIQERENQLQSLLKPQEVTLPSGVYYHPVVFKGSYDVANTVNVTTEKDLLTEYKEYKGDIDVDESEIADIIGLFKQGRDSVYHIDYVVSKCVNDNGDFDDDKINIVKTLATFGVAASSIPEMLEEIQSLSDTNFVVSFLSDICSFKANGLNDISAMMCARFLRSDFENPDDIKSSMRKLFNINVSPEMTVALLDSLKVKSPETAQYTVNKTAVDSLVSMKRTMSKTRDNEKQEAANPINLLGVRHFVFGDSIIVTKDGKVTYSTSISDTDITAKQQEYKELISLAEDNVLKDFVKEYKNSDGTLNGGAVRGLLSLRNKGITYNELLNILGFCTSDEGFVFNSTINDVEALKKAGALSKDIPIILEACSKNDDGTYDKADVQIASELTSAVLGGKYVLSFLPEIKKCEEIKNFLVYFSEFFEDKSKLNSMLDMVKDTDGNYQENAIYTFYNLTEMMMNNDDFSIGKLISSASDVLNVITDVSSGKITDDAAGALSILSKCGKCSIEDILNILSKCKDENGNISEILTDIVWESCVQESSSEQINRILDICRKEDGTINKDRAKGISSALEYKMPLEQIFAMIIG